jgi:short-subunit dehydrogenase
MTQTYLITGATSGIGEALARTLAARGDAVIGTGRREERLAALAQELGERFRGVQMDVLHVEESVRQFEELFADTPIDVVILNAGVSLRGEDLDWQRDLTIVQTNAAAFAAQAAFAVRHFLERGNGHLVGITSVASQLVSGRSAAYCASKSFGARYLRGLRMRVQLAGKQDEVHITDLRPGFIWTPLIENRDGVFWAIRADRCAEIMLPLIDRKVKARYVPRRWWWIAQIGRIMPDAVMRRGG